MTTDDNRDGHPATMSVRTSRLDLLVRSVRKHYGHRVGIGSQQEADGSLPEHPSLRAVILTIIEVQNNGDAEGADMWQRKPNAVLTYHGAMPYFSDPETAELLITRPELAQRIASLLIERGNIGGEQLRAVIDSEAPAVSDGVL